jgi:hypothetical protein
MFPIRLLDSVFMKERVLVSESQLRAGFGEWAYSLILIELSCVFRTKIHQK